MLPEHRLREELQRLDGIGLRRTCFRIVELGVLLANNSPTLLYDEGPSRYGQRFSPPGDHRGLYLAESKQAAGCEYADGIENWRRGDGSSHAVLEVEVCLNSVLDLTDAGVRRALRTSLDEVQAAWFGHFELLGKWPPTWELGHHAYTAGRFDGIRYASTKDRTGVCLLTFTERLYSHGSHVVIRQRDGRVWERLPHLDELPVSPEGPAHQLAACAQVLPEAHQADRSNL